jgi:hypothetical protein
MAPKLFLSIPIYSNRCEYDILKGLLKKNDQNLPIGCIKLVLGDFWQAKLFNFAGSSVVCPLWWLDRGAILFQSALIYSNKCNYDILNVSVLKNDQNVPIGHDKRRLIGSSGGNNCCFFTGS